jgi:hypothetical protein
MSFKKFALAFGIAIILPMMLNYGASTIAPKPQRGEYDFSAMLDSMAEKNTEKRNQIRAEKQKKTEERNQILRRHEKTVFFISVPMGILAIILGAFLAAKAIGGGLIFGGIFSICNGYANHWSNLSNGLRFVSLLVAFVVLVFVGYKKIESRSPGNKANQENVGS